MIRIILGNIGSGKTAMAVRDMALSHIPIYSNIITKNIKNNNIITKKDIIKEEIVSFKRTGEPVIKKKLNEKYWHNIKQKNKSLSVYIDEAHTILNPRRSMSETNKIMGDFLALLRRVVGSNEHQYGELVLISQLERRLDIIAKEMATLVQFCICYYEIYCPKCKSRWSENNETSKKITECSVCGNYRLKKENFIIEVYNFKNIDKFHLWFDYKEKSYFEIFYITNIEMVFPLYDTLQWENLLSD